MPLLGFQRKELTLLLKFYEEALSLHGIRVNFYKTRALYDGGTVTHTQIILDEEPRPDTLRRLNWFINKDEMPILAWVSYILEAEQGSIITLPGAFEGELREFEVTRVQTFKNTPVIHVCKLAPLYHTTAAINLDNQNSIFNVQ